MSDRLLVVDVGNTQTVLGVYEGDALRAHFRIASQTRRTIDELAALVQQLLQSSAINPADVTAAITSSVAPQSQPVIDGFIEALFGVEPLRLGPGVKTGVVITVDNPKEVGADRIANAAGALARFTPPFVLVDFGTAITIDAISAKAEYLGGAIVPGVRLSLNALYHHAAKLPEVALAEPPSVIGKNTIHSMQAGAVFGYAALVDGIVDRMKQEVDGSPLVIATGGEAGSVAPFSRTIERVEEMLTLEGLRAIYQRQQL